MKINPSRFAVRSPAPDYRPESRWPTALLFAGLVALVLLGALAEGILP